MQAEQVEAAIWNARFHGATDHVGHEQVGPQAQSFGRTHPVLFGGFHLFSQAARGGAQAVQGKMGDKAADFERFDVLFIEAVEHAGEGIDRNLAPLGNA